MAKIRVLLVDDHEIVRLGLMTLMNDRDDMQVIGEAGNAAEALDKVARLTPDVVLMDIRLPGESGIEATRQIAARHPASKVVMLTSFTDDDLVVRAIAAGAVGYVLKKVGNEELVRAIVAAARGEAVLDPATTLALLARVRLGEQKADREAFRSLSPRELDVLSHLSRGRTNAEIAHALNLSEKTVGNYVGNMFEKLGLNNRVELAAYALEHHLFDQKDPE